MTEKDYLTIYYRFPDPNNNSEYHKHYEHEEADYKALIDYNKKLIQEYPFLLPRNRWTGEVSENYDYSYTELDSMPKGWRLAFGLEMVKEIKAALLSVQEKDPNGGYPENYITTNYDSDKILSYLDGFRITDIKEKYGTLRFYCGGAPQEVYDVINKYEKLSEKYCINCGQPSKYWSTGWVSPYCVDCAEQQILDYNDNNSDTVYLEDMFEEMR